jgi:hypothetical protein
LEVGAGVDNFDFTYGYLDADSDTVDAATDIGASVVKVGYGMRDIKNLNAVYDDGKLAFCIVLTYQAKGKDTTDTDFTDFSKIEYTMQQEITISGDLQFDVGPLTITSSDDKKEQEFQAQTIEQAVTAKLCQKLDDNTYEENTEPNLFVGDALSVCVFPDAEGLEVSEINNAFCTNTESKDQYSIIGKGTVVNPLFTEEIKGKNFNNKPMMGFKTAITSEYIGELWCNGDVTLSSRRGRDRRRGLQISSNEGTIDVASGSLDDDNSGKFAINLNIVGSKGQGYNDIDSLSLSSAATAVTASFSSSTKGMVGVLILAVAAVVVDWGAIVE